jgi:hypothetical protein
MSKKIAKCLSDSAYIIITSQKTNVFKYLGESLRTQNYR